MKNFEQPRFNPQSAVKLQEEIERFRINKREEEERSLLVENLEKMTKTELSRTRHFLTTLQEHEKNRYIPETDKHRIQRIRENIAETAPPIFKLEDTEDVFESVSAMKNEQLVNFLQWHLWNVAKQSESFAENRVPELAHQFMEKLKRAIENGEVPPEILDHYRELIPRVRYEVRDPIDSITSDIIGSYTNHGDVVKLDPELDPEELLSTFIHEMLHARRATKQNEDKYVWNLGTSYRPHRSRILEEALTEHLTLLLTREGSSNMSPFYSNGEHAPVTSGTYVIEREFVDFIMSRGLVDVDLDELVEAYWDLDGNKEHEVIFELTKALGKNTLSSLPDGIELDYDIKDPKQRVDELHREFSSYILSNKFMVS